MPVGNAASAWKPLLPPDEENFLRLYGRELFDDMVANEYKSQFPTLLTN